MAAKEETKPDQDHGESTIPVFTVLKNGAILKNIFIVNNSPPPHNLIASFQNDRENENENEEVLILGRHPDCNIMLTHPSISRFHLQIHSKSSSQKLSVVDLSSVHGTWVSDKKIESGARVEMREGDTLRVGGSSRIYRLHWVPLSLAYDFQSPAVSALGETTTEKKEEEDAISEVKAVETYEKENSLLDENKETQLQEEDSVFSSISPIYSDENWNMGFEQKENDSKSLSMVEDGRSNLVKGKQWFGNENESSQLHSLPLSAENFSFNVEDIIMSSFFGGESKSPSRDKFEQKETSLFRTIPFGNESINLSMVDDSATRRQQFDDENESLKPHSLPLSSENFSFNVEEIITSSFFGSERESSSEDKFEQKETGSIRTIPFKHDSEIFSMVDDEQSASEDGNQQVGNEIEQPNFMHLAVENLSLDVDVLVETENKPVLEVKPSIKPLPVLQSQDITENKEFVIDFSLTSEERNQEVEILDMSRVKVEEVYADEGNDKLNHQDQVMESTSEEKSNLPMNYNVACSPEESYCAEFETVESTKSASKIDFEQKELLNLDYSVPCSMDFVDSSLLDEDVSSEIEVKKEILTTGPLSPSSEPSDIQMLETSPLISENRPAMESIWSRRGKVASFPRIKTGISGGNGKENTLLSHLSGGEEEIFTPDKENLTPKTLLMKSLNKKAKMDQRKSVLRSSSKMNKKEELSQGSDKENQTPKVLQERKSSRQVSKNRMRLEKEKSMMKRGAERTPFQSLQFNLPAKSRSETPIVYSAAKSDTSVNCTEAMKNKAPGEGKKHWTMVVDINSLLNKESMKSLQLLQGLCGTQLVIPRMVIRELDCLRRNGSFFRRTTEASSVLQWIEHCMVKTRWWIVQSSVEEVGPTAPTPSSIPQFPQYAEEILSPTAEDHILDFALHFRKMNEGQIVLLSDDVALKIKAMAEGLMCETAKEFRESLVNPFSERFMWGESSPRGLTWCCSDDVVLRERYERCCSLKPSKGESAKGLKLILLHNSHYGR